jgi:transposase
MAMRRIPMIRIKEALRLHEDCGLSLRKTSKALSVSRTVLTEYIKQCKKLGITYTKAKTMSDDELINCFTAKQKEDPRFNYLFNKFSEYSRELSKVGVTRRLLWEEYKNDNPDGYNYSQFCHYFRQWNENQELYMRIDHKAGDKLFVDYAGKKMEIVDPKTGEIKPVEIFIASLGVSKLIYAEAVWTQQKHDFIQAQVNALNYIGGVPQAIVPDCLKTAVTKGHRYEPDINPEYQDFASHYGTCILPARPYKPKDKAIVEGAVRIVYQKIYAPLRNRIFYSLEELNQAIRKQLELLNNRPLTQYKVSRWELFNEMEKDALSPLPVEDYTIRCFKKCKVHFNYHIYLSDDNHYYSVPYQHRGKHVEVRYTSTIVEIYLKNSRIALHKRNYGKLLYTTVKDHMPPEHKFMNDWNAEKFITWGKEIGNNTKETIERILYSKQHPEQGYKVCLGILNLAREYSKERLEKACQRALYYDSLSLKVIRNILHNSLENIKDDKASTKIKMFDHKNIRGPKYYN